MVSRLSMAHSGQDSTCKVLIWNWTRCLYFNQVTVDSFLSWSCFAYLDVVSIVGGGCCGFAFRLHPSNLLHNDFGMILKCPDFTAIHSLSQSPLSINTLLLFLEVRAAICCLLLGCRSLLSFLATVVQWDAKRLSLHYHQTVQMLLLPVHCSLRPE